MKDRNRKCCEKITAGYFYKKQVSTINVIFIYPKYWPIALCFVDIGGLTVESAACFDYGVSFPGRTYRVAITLDDYAYSGVHAATHEIGHMYELLGHMYV